ncbi:HNH endonuclease family protein [Streptomyces spiralis]
MRFARTAAAAAAVAALLIPATAHTAAAATPRSHAAPGETVTLPVREALAEMPVRDEDRTGYERSKFKHWIDADRDGCNTRAEVLKAEAVVAPVQGANCTLTGGQWYSPYDDRYIDGPRGLDIDHLVPLAEAWDSGAYAWSAKEREAYANDLGDDRALIAVSAASNRSKADQDPSTWLPPAVGYRCTYVTDWVTDKTRWGLSVDPAERDALSDLFSQCPNTTVTVTLAR